MPEISVHTDGVQKLLQRINPNKACGPDMIPAKFLKQHAENLAPILSQFFKKTLDEGAVPEDWRQANVSAIFKKGERFKASNYRPVSLTSLCCKLQEHILTSNIMRHLDKHSILTDCQHGFRERRGCETQLLTLTHELAQSLDKKKQVDMVILDFSKTGPLWSQRSDQGMDKFLPLKQEAESSSRRSHFRRSPSVKWSSTRHRIRTAPLPHVHK